jgi:hypothetical protein
MVDGLVGGGVFEVGRGQFVGHSRFEGGDDVGEEVVVVLGVVLQQLFGVAVDFAVVLPLRSLADGLDLVLSALHWIYYNLITHLHVDYSQHTPATLATIPPLSFTTLISNHSVTLA